MSMEHIDSKARVLAEARERLAEAVTALQAAQQALLREQLPAIKRHLKRAFQLDAELKALVAENPALFEKPRTVVLHGLKVGFQKGKGKVVIGNAAQVVRLIEKKLPDLAEVLIETKKAPSKAAIAQLTVEQLKAIGCKVEDAGDVIVVRAVDDVVDKLVAAMLKSLGEQSSADEEADQAA